MKEEWKQVLQSTWMKVVLIAIICIPTIYAGVFLGSMWDPYGNTDQMQVAVVNHDEAVKFQSTTLHVGDDLLNNLKNNKAMDFVFTNEKKAAKGLQEGTYYMVITIPKTFSKNATTLLDENPKKMELQYTTNPGSNYIASKMDETAIRTIKEQVSATITQTYANTIFSSVETLSAGIKDASDGSTKLYDGTLSAVDGNQVIQTNLETLANSTLTFRDGATTFAQGLQQYSDGVTSVNDGAIALHDGLEELQTKSQSLEGGVKQLQSGSTSLHYGIIDYTQGVDTLQAGFTQLSQSSPTLTTGMDQISQGSSGVLKGLQGVSSILHANMSDEQKLAAINAYMDGTSQSAGILTIMSAMDAGINGEHGLKNGLSTYMGGVTTLQQGASQLQEASKSLVDGSTQLQQGTTTLVDSMPSLQVGITRLVDGSNTLSVGTQTLVQNSPTLLQGANQLQNGSTQIQSGASQLAQGSTTLGMGLSQMQTGTYTLSSALRDGSNESNVTFTNKTSEMFAQPLTLKHKEINHVESNGKAMAPYMMSVGMYVACMAFTLVYPLLENNSKTSSGFKMWLGKAGVMYGVSTFMAILMVLMLTLLNGLSPAHLLSTTLMACLISAAFMSMVVFFNVTLGKIGAFLVLIFMVFQLGGAAGTYPIETSNAFYQAIHPFMPFTYCVEAFRNTLALSNTIQTDILIFSGMIIVFSCLSIIFYHWLVSVGEERFHRTHLAQFH